MTPSSYWAPLCERKRELSKKLPFDQFRRNELGMNIDNANGAHKRIAWLERNTMEAWRAMKSKIDSNLTWLVVDGPKGNPYRFEFDGLAMTYASIEYAYMASQLFAYAAPFRRVVEIGGGYGGLARAVMLAWPNTHYTIVDLPEVSQVSKYFLADYAYDESGCHGVDWIDVDATMFLKDPRLEGPVDLFINTRSFGEMEIDQVTTYCNLIERSIRPAGHFYCVNRIAKLVRFCDYPIPETWAKPLDDSWPLQASLREVMFEAPS